VTAKTPAPECSRPFAPSIGWVRRRSSKRSSPLPEECAALAKRLRIRALSQLSATVRFESRPGGLIHSAAGWQQKSCKDLRRHAGRFSDSVEDSFELDFGDSPMSFGDEIDLDVDHDPPEPIEAGAIDAGELVRAVSRARARSASRAPGASLDQSWPIWIRPIFRRSRVLKRLKPSS